MLTGYVEVLESSGGVFLGFYRDGLKNGYGEYDPNGSGANIEKGYYQNGEKKTC